MHALLVKSQLTASPSAPTSNQILRHNKKCKLGFKGLRGGVPTAAERNQHGKSPARTWLLDLLNRI